jgi:hypothetical protein
MRKALTLASYGLAGWAICGGTIAVGRQLLSMQTTLIVHAFVAPAVFGSLTVIFFKRFPSSSPIGTAAALLSLVVALDFFVVAQFVERSYAMFTSALGTWLPFTLIFAASYAAGRLTGKDSAGIGVNRNAA